MVVYEYEVKNKMYKSKTIGNFVGFSNDQKYAENLIKNYPEKSEIKVFYCPFYPGYSVLLSEMQQTAAHYILLFTGVVVSLGSAPVLFSDNPYWFVDIIWQFIDIVT